VNHRVILAGATGVLGRRIASELARRGAAVRALVRPNAPQDKTEHLRADGIEVVPVALEHAADLARACEGGSVVVSALSGLHDVIVEGQTQLLEAAIRAGVRRFIPSDFAIDFPRIPEGSNRNLDLRNEFRHRVDASAVQATSILNGAFTDMLTGQAPFILFRIRRILCWDDPDQAMDWTTIADTAAYTAEAALEPATPRFLRIAGDQASARDLAAIMTEITGERYKLLRPGGLGTLRLLIRLAKLTNPDSASLYPAWQGMQYMHDMYSGVAKFHALDNARYPIDWTRVREVLRAFVKTSRSPAEPLV
jgi:nucleoside-diphosphate-sugar epimerase